MPLNCVSGVPRFIYCSNPAVSQPTALHEAGTFAGATWARIALRVFFPACAALNPRNERAAEFDMYSPDFPAAIRDQSFQLLAAFLLLLPEKALY